jgi:hypothetical protein
MTDSFKRALLALLLAGFSLSGCATVETVLGSLSGHSKDETFPTPVLNVKPELDYSKEYPSCTVAGQRLAENVEVGMTLKDVVRLVGQPRLKVTGSWWWSKSFSQSGKPRVRFGLHRGRDDTIITAISTDVSRCDDN